MTEDRETRIKRLRMRSIRRGIREMDLILTAFSEHALVTMDDDALDDYDALLSENDHDIYGWVTGQAAPPDRYATLLTAIAAGAEGLTRAD